jgi:hypothetical protein
MALFVWIMAALAIWHFTIFLPDRYWGGIVGAFVGALAGGVLLGLALNGFSLPGRDETDVVTVFEAIPGAMIGIALMYFEGVRREKRDTADSHASGLT